MANRTFENDGFWERVDKAVLASGMSKREIAEKMGVERKALYSWKSANGDKRSWHSGRVASFCKITGVSADWLLGISNVGMLKPKKVKPVWTSDGLILFWQPQKAKNWDDEAVKYVVYRFAPKEKIDLDDASKIVAITSQPMYKLDYLDGKTKYTYVVTALNRLSNESAGAKKKVKL